MEQEHPELRAGALMRQGLTDAFRPPFSLLLALGIFVYVVSASVSQRGDEANLAFAVLLAVVSAYAQIGCTLAAGAPDPSRSADTWLIAGFRRRCFWRFVLTELAIVALIAIGLVGFVVGAFVVGAVVALAQAAAVLERRSPIDAIKRSHSLGRPARRALGVVFGALVLVPGVGLQVAYTLKLEAELGAPFVVAGLVSVLLALAGTIALARAFVSLGGAPTPPLDDISPRPRPGGASSNRP